VRGSIVRTTSPAKPQSASSESGSGQVLTVEFTWLPSRVAYAKPGKQRRVPGRAERIARPGQQQSFAVQSVFSRMRRWFSFASLPLAHPRVRSRSSPPGDSMVWTAPWELKRKQKIFTGKQSVLRRSKSTRWRWTKESKRRIRETRKLSLSCDPWRRSLEFGAVAHARPLPRS